MKCSPGTSNFLEEISNIYHSIVFLYFFALFTEEGFIFSPYYSLELCIQLGISFPFSFAFCFSSFLSYLSGLLRQPCCLLAFLFLWDGFVHCILCNVMNLCPLDLIPWIYLSLLLYNRKGFNKVILEWPSGFHYFLQFKSEFCNKELMIWATANSWSCFYWLYRAFPSFASKNINNLKSVLTIWWCPCRESSLVLLENGVCYDQCILLAKLC